MENIKILDAIVPNYTEKFLSGQYSLDEMPLLEAIAHRFMHEMQTTDCNDVYIVACQHLLKPQLAMFEQFVKLGIPALHIMVLPKIYSANQSVLAGIKNLGCTVFEDALNFHPSQNFDDFHYQQCESVVRHVEKTVPASAKLIVLDDGGMLIKTFAQHKKLIRSFEQGVYGVEQTASGKNILLKTNVPFIVTSVASSIEKITIETNYIIRHVMTRLTEYFVEQEISKSSKLLVLGKGPIGKTLISALTREGYDCDGYDSNEGSFKGSFSSYDVIIGATGSNSVSIKQLPNLKASTHLISVSSSDREFPSVHIRKNSVAGKGTHDTFVYKENGIRLANGGFPITFKGKETECFPLEMDVTMMKLTEAVLMHVLSKTDIETSINQMYAWKKLFLHTPVIYCWFATLLGFIVIKLLLIGMHPLSTVWYLVFLPLVLYGSYPALWQICYYRKLEKHL
ncbi:MAG TPA: hypothetical protein VG621_03680 [Candidatus Paceibacterota bacterium]|nr:hypothetical protein [Candidatus Paceibacterota bacterium]